MTDVVVGVDTYSFHRRLGEVRPGEDAPAGDRWTWDMALGAAVNAGAEVVALETCFMSVTDCRRVLQVEPTTAMLSWGHPYGLAYGRSVDAEQDAASWMTVATDLGHARMRVVIAHPHLRDPGDGWPQARECVPALTRLARRAEDLGLVLAIENHADVTAGQLAWILESIGSPALEVCFDTANALRVQDDPVEAARTLAPWISIAHIKDVDASAWHAASGPVSVALGTGSIDVRGVVESIIQSRPTCWLLVELGHLGPGQVDEAAWVAQDMAWLRRQATALL